MEMDVFEFLEKCELELINQLCKNCPELPMEKIEEIAEEFSKEIDRQLLESEVIV